MRILILSDINSSHTQKWARGIAGRGNRVSIFSLSFPNDDWFIEIPNLEVVYTPKKRNNSGRFATKAGYLFKLAQLKKCIKNFQPDVVHAHYASSYGLLAVMSGFKPAIISVWGADIYDFPKKNRFNNWLIRYVLKNATEICSTSNCMAREIEIYCNKPIHTIPFGLNTAEFPFRIREIEDKKPIVIGAIKALTPKYGTDYLIKAFKKLCDSYPERFFKLLLVGSGSHEKTYKELVKSLEIESKTEFTGNISHNDIAKFHDQLDIFVGLSILDSESFGVSLVEAMASGAFVVASDVPGYREVLMESNNLGLLVKRKSVDEAVKAMITIIDNPIAAKNRSLMAVKSIRDRYEWKNNLDLMLNVYEKVKSLK